MTVDKLPKWEQSSLRVRVDFKRFIRRQLRAKSWQSWKTESVGKRGRCGYELPHKANHHRVVNDHKPRKECNGSSWQLVHELMVVLEVVVARRKRCTTWILGKPGVRRESEVGFGQDSKKAFEYFCRMDEQSIERRAKKRRLKQLKTKRTDKW